jgi:hypothetical protein
LAEWCSERSTTGATLRGLRAAFCPSDDCPPNCDECWKTSERLARALHGRVYDSHEVWLRVKDMQGDIHAERLRLKGIAKPHMSNSCAAAEPPPPGPPDDDPPVVPGWTAVQTPKWVYFVGPNGQTKWAQLIP